MTTENNASRERVLTLVFTDLVGSTALKSELGDRAVSALIAQHRAQIDRLVTPRAGRVIDWAGDGCFLTFETPSAAVLFALALQQAHAAEPELPGVRIGVHLGEITESSPRGSGTRVEGLAVDLAARISSLARPSQILMSSAVFNNVRQRIRGEELGIAIAWRAHGPYELGGFEDTIDICEAGIVGISPLEPPVGSEKAHRAVTPGEEDTFGWRPAIGLNVQRRDNWMLEEQLGQGGFGEVWLAVHAKTRAKRVFKFCFEPERVRGLKREVVLFRLLKETLGSRDDIAQILDWDFEHTPYFIESEYTEGGDLRAWAAAQGGLDRVPLGTRLELIAQIAVALAAAHSVGVLHKDIKPANVLISDKGGKSTPAVVLTDFGIGLITDPAALAARGITAVGLTLTLSGASGSETGAGTRLYVAPELLEGKPATTLSDIYSLGVVLYQMVIGDLTHAVGSGWERDVPDDLLREDITACLDGDPTRRLRSAGELAERLRTLESRRAERNARREFERHAEHTRRRRRQLTTIAAVALTIAIVAALFSWQAYRRAGSERRLNLEAQAARTAAEKQLYYAQIQLAASQINQSGLDSAISALENTPPAYRNWEWGYLVRLAFADLLTPRQSAPAVIPAATTSRELWRGSRAVTASSWREHATEINMLHLAHESGAAFSVSDDGTLRMWDLDAGKSVRALGDGNDALFCVDYHPESRRIAAAGFDGILYVWDAKTGDVLHALDVPGSSAIFDVAFDRLGGKIYSASTGMIGVFDLERKIFDDPIVYDGAVMSDLAIDAEGHLTAVSLNGRVMSWDVKSKEAGTVVHNQEVENSTSAVLSPNMDLVLSGLPDRSAVLWNARTGESKCRLAGKVPSITHVASFSPDGSAVAVPDERNGAAVYSTETGERLADLAVADDGIRSVAFHPGGRHVLVGGVQGTLRVWEPAPKDVVDSNVLQGHTDTIYFTSFSPDGRQLASASFDHSVRVWDVDTGQQVAVLNEHSREVLHAIYSADGRYLRTQDTDHTVRIWDAAHRFNLLHTIVADPDHQWPVASQRIRAVDMMGGAAMMGAMIDPASAKISVNLRDSVGIYDCASGKQVANFRHDGFRAGFQAFSRDGRIMVSTATGLEVWAIDATTGALLHRFKGHTGPVTMPSISPDGRWAVTGSFDKTIRVWDLVHGGEYRKFEGHQAFVVTARFDATGKHVLSSSGDSTARIWDVESGKEAARLSGHGSTLINADYSPSGDRILTYGWDNTAKVWDTSGRELVTIPMEKGIVHGVWSPDGRMLALSGADGRLHLVRALPWEKFDQAYTGEHWLRNAIAQWVQEETE